MERIKKTSAQDVQISEVEFELTDEDRRLIMFVKLFSTWECESADHVIPFPIERIVTTLTAQGRQKDIIDHVYWYFTLYQKVNFSRILDSAMAKESELINAWPLFCYGEDRYGHPIVYDEIFAHKKYIGNVMSITQDKTSLIKQYRYRFQRRVSDYKLATTKRLNKCIFKHSIVMDCTQFSISKHLNAKKVKRLLMDIAEEESVLFVGTVCRVYLINVPVSLKLVLKCIKKKVHADILRMFRICGKDYRKQLLQDIDVDQIPPKYGGTGTQNIVLGQ